MNYYACTAVVFGEPVCKQQCGACAEWDRRQAAQEALQWRHHAGAGAAHVLPHPDAREALCGAYQPGQWPDKWERGDGGLRRNRCAEIDEEPATVVITFTNPPGCCCSSCGRGHS